MEKIIGLIDMDCFYVQVEQKLNPELRDLPCAVVQYKPWKGGGIIAVNYEARALGVRRGMFGDDAKKLCPDIKLPRVQEIRGKADLTRYRNGSKEIFDILTQFTENVEKASIDEAFLDLTLLVKNRIENDFNQKKVTIKNLPTTCIVSKYKREGVGQNEAVKEWLEEIYDDDTASWDDHPLAVAAVIMEEIRAEVLKKTMYKCSAGISHNKMLSKFICGLNKPNHQTILPRNSLSQLYTELPLKKIRNLGGKLGDSLVEELGCQTMADLANLSLKQLQNRFGDKTGNWLFGLGKGIEDDPVNPRQVSKSIGCSKHFFGKSALRTQKDVKYWLTQFAEEIVERGLQDQEANKRMAKVLTVSIKIGTIPGATDATRSCSITIYDSKKISLDAFSLLQKFNTAKSDLWVPPVLSMSMSIGKFQDQLQGNASIESFLKKEPSSASLEKKFRENDKMENDMAAKPSGEKKDELLRERNVSVPSLEICFTDEVSPGLEERKENSKKGFFATKLAKLSNQHDQEITNLKEMEKNLIWTETPINEAKKNKPQDTVQNESKLKLAERIGKEHSLKASKSSGMMKYFKPLTKDKQQTNNIELIATEGTSSNNLHEQNEIDISFNLIDGLENDLCCSSDSEDITDCPECNQKILSTQIREHKDFHFADKLQKEFNNETVNGIKEEDDPFDDKSKIACTECNKFLLVEEIEEHQDFHIAQKLEKEINSTMTTNQAGKISLVTNKKRKSKRQNIVNKKLRSVDSYFK